MYKDMKGYENPDIEAFEIRFELQTDLDQGGEISKALLQELNEEEYLVSQCAYVSTQEENKKWIITDMHNGNEFTIKKNAADALYVYPGREDMKIWRYLDFTKLVSLLKQKALFFNRADNFEDKLEGTFPSGAAMVHDHFRNIIESETGTSHEGVPTGQELSNRAEIVKMYTFVNCWHINKHESSAMWNLYLKNHEEGIAVQSTYELLRDSFKNYPDDVYIGKVKYEPMNTVVSIPELNNPELHKGQNFAHECEIRAVIKLSPKEIDARTQRAVEKYQELHNNGELIQKIHNDPNLKAELFELSPGKIVSIEPEELIEKIVVSPTAREWFFELVKLMAEDYGLGEKVMKSEIGWLEKIKYDNH